MQQAQRGQKAQCNSAAPSIFINQIAELTTATFGAD